MQPEIAGAAVAGAAMEAGEIAAIFEGIVELLDALKDLDDVLDSLSGVGDIDVDIPDINGDFALEMSDGWRSAIEKAYEMKNMSTKFNDIRLHFFFYFLFGSGALEITLCVCPSVWHKPRLVFRS